MIHHGRYERLPDYLNPDLEACKHLTRVLGCVDGNLLAVWNKLAQRYEVWGPSREYGWYLISACEDPYTGKPCAPETYPMVILADLRSRDHDPDMRALTERNAQAVEAEWMKWMDTKGEEAAYFGACVAQEASGSPIRHGLEDVVRGYELALEGRTKGDPIGQRIFVPGVSPYGG